MKRFLVLLAMVGMLLAAPMAHLAFAKPIKEKVNICHVNDILVDDVIGVIAFGKVIRVSANAVPAHVAHGDSREFFSLDLFEDLFGITLPLLKNADCVFVVLPVVP
ncbi:MAG: hypothetical protein WKF77_15450 [Planctomycetaceae bacterium]